MFGNHGLGGLLKEGAHGKSPKLLPRYLENFAKLLAFFIKPPETHPKTRLTLPSMMLLASIFWYSHS
ncbi:hypothetical protein FAH66_09115 [Neisseria subflava]|nr:hypothetical protein FAH66_09115 [Neisseria subflava]